MKTKDVADGKIDPNDNFIEPETSDPPTPMRLPAYRVFRVLFEHRSPETVTAHFWDVRPDGSAVFGDWVFAPCSDPSCSDAHPVQLYRRAIRNWVDITEVLNVHTANGVQ
jgi:hypothetical protein